MERPADEFLHPHMDLAGSARIEAGLLVEDATLAGAVRAQFESLVAAGWLRRVAGLGVPEHPRP